MDLKVTYVVWLLVICINQTVSANDSRPGGGAGGGGSGAGAGGGGAGGGSGGGAGGGSGGGAGGGSGGGAGGGSGGGAGGAGGGGGQGGAMGPGYAMNGMGMNGMGMNGMQLPFPFFQPFACEMECLPVQYQFVPLPMQPVQPAGPATSRPVPAPTPPAPTTTMPTTTARQIITTQRPMAPNTYISQTYIMYPNWCQGWCRFFYKPTPPPVYYQPNCLLFSWMGMGTGMGM